MIYTSSIAGAWSKLRYCLPQTDTPWDLSNDEHTSALARTTEKNRFNDQNRGSTLLDLFSVSRIQIQFARGDFHRVMFDLNDFFQCSWFLRARILLFLRKMKNITSQQVVHIAISPQPTRVGDSFPMTFYRSRCTVALPTFKRKKGPNRKRQASFKVIPVFLNIILV